MPIHTVLGPIDAAELGPTSMHEHLFLEAAQAFGDAETEMINLPVTIERLGDLHWNTVSNAANLTLDEPDVTVAELRRFHKSGGRAMVDVTPLGLGRRVADLPEVARRSQVHILVGCGFYRSPSHPPWMEERSAQQLAEYLIDELENGLDGTGIRPALIGEVGTIDPVAEAEWRVLHAAAIAAAETGAAISVHIDPQGQYQALDILEWLVGHGADPSRVVIGHLDEILDLDNQRALMRAGATVEYDLFGAEFYYPGRENYVTDYQRMDAVKALIEEGFAEKLVFGCDIHMKMMLRVYGGMGYAHLMERIVPSLIERFHVDREHIDQILVKNPARLLDRP